ncbi:MAG TPA: WD40 repeat domain-containing protein, partial [Acidimicrobiia bacterium]|nr:WD40 repeat domain-containing protein [Acidimicrobiia bacterium]
RFDASSAVPPSLLTAFGEEPRWVDLSWVEEETQLDMRNSRFREAVADIASALHGVSKDDLESEEVLQHRRTRRTAWAAGTLLLLLAVAALGGAVVAVDQRREAEAQRAAAEAETARAVAAESLARAEAARAVSAESLARARELAASAIRVLDEDPELSILLGLEAIAIAPEGAAQPVAALNALREGVHATRLRARWVVAGPDDHVWLDLAPDDTKLVVVSEPAGTVKLLDVGTSEERWVFRDPATVDSFFLPSFSADGSQIAVGVIDSANSRTTNFLRDVPRKAVVEDDDAAPRVLILDAATGAVTRTLVFPDCAEAVPVPSFSPDGRWLAVGGLPRDDCSTVDGTEVILYDAVTLEPLHRVATGGDLHLSWSKDGTALVVGNDYGPATQHRPDTDVIDTASGQISFDLPYFAGAISPDGTTIAVDLVNDLELFDVGTGVAFDKLSGINQLITSKVFTADGSRLVVGTRSEEVLVFDLDTGEMLQRVGSAGLATSFDCDLTCDTLYQASVGGEVLSWDLSLTGGGELSATDTGYWVNADSISIASDSGAFLGYPLRGGTVPDVVPFDRATGLVLSPRRRTGAQQPAALPDGRIVLLDVFDATPEWGPVVAWDPGSDSVELITGCSTTNEAVAASQLGRASTPDCVDADEPYFLLYRALLSPDEESLLLLSSAGELRIVDAQTLGQTARMTLPEGPDALLAYGGSWLLVSEGESARVQSVDDGQVLATLDNGSYTSWAAISPDFDRLSIAEFTGEVVIYDTASWQAVTTFDNGAQQRGQAFSPDGTKLLTAGNDGYVRIWDTATGTELGRIPVPNPSDGYWLDENHIVVGTSSGLWTTLTLDQAELEQLAASRLTRGFTPAECELYLIEPCSGLEAIRTRYDSPVGG